LAAIDEFLLGLATNLNGCLLILPVDLGEQKLNNPASEIEAPIMRHMVFPPTRKNN